MDKIYAPFTAEQVTKLNQYQQLKFDVFTCGGPKIKDCFRSLSTELRGKGFSVAYTPTTEGNLIATREGWVCPCGQYNKQDWTWKYMAE